MKTKIIALMAAGLLTMSLVAPAFAAARTPVSVCHENRDGSFVVLEVSQHAWLNAHQPNHTGDDLMPSANCPPLIQR